MATDLENLIQTRSNYIARQLEMSQSRKPTYTVDGETYNWETYDAMLSAKIDSLNLQIQRAGGSWEVRTIGRV